MGFRFAAGVVALTLALAAWAAPAWGETFRPTKRSDPVPDVCKKKDCSLREAVLAANLTSVKDKIVLKKGKPYKLKQEGAVEEATLTGDLDVIEDLVIKGSPKATVNGKRIDRVFDVPDLSMITLKISKLTVTGGQGGGVNVGSGGTLKIARSTVKNNRNPDPGGGVSVQAMGTATINRSTIADNKGGGGGGVYATGMTTILNSTVSGNRSTGTGGGVKSQASLGFIARNSTFTKNKAETDGGGISVLSGAATLNNVTIARNTADTDGTGGTDVGGGITAAGMVNVANSIIALNKLGGDPMPIVDVNCDGTFTSGGGNVRNTDDTGCMGFMGTDDLVDDQPKLGKLAKNGGSTKTIALKSGSPAINNAIPASAEPKDQRGRSRGGNPDSGAFER